MDEELYFEELFNSHEYEQAYLEAEKDQMYQQYLEEQNTSK